MLKRVRELVGRLIQKLMIRIYSRRSAESGRLRAWKIETQFSSLANYETGYEVWHLLLPETRELEMIYVQCRSTHLKPQFKDSKADRPFVSVIKSK
ncbi:hypothetical protein EAF00_004715 [Botryotinia globosa]|nr:hypothetical protein EAF00_004715 [Botryotinia globosa]